MACRLTIESRFLSLNVFVYDIYLALCLRQANLRNHNCYRVELVGSNWQNLAPTADELVNITSLEMSIWTDEDVKRAASIYAMTPQLRNLNIEFSVFDFDPDLGCCEIGRNLLHTIFDPQLVKHAPQNSRPFGSLECISRLLVACRQPCSTSRS
jgi:hypothetical protein